ncbi:transferase [Lithospermum erythrorhizon]|uniref:Sulfotransferase n=1 Tax=Lithospermum erythrorhizon TaxID=34254 RepID=A0AAV3QZP7_LITER
MLATHAPIGLLPKSLLESKCKLVYLSRNPKDTFVSYWHFAMNTKPENYAGVSSIEEGVDMFCKGLIICGPFWDHVLDYWNASLEKSDNVFFLTYEQLLSEPIPLVRRLADFLGYGFSTEEEDSRMVDAIVKMCSFENLSKLEVNNCSNKVSGDGFTNKSFFWRGEAGDWKNHLMLELANLLDDVTEQKFIIGHNFKSLV